MDFAFVETEYRQLKSQFDAGQLTEADFKARLQELMIQNEQDRWWMIGYETGQWYVHDGEKWLLAEPPRPEPHPLAVIGPSDEGGAGAGADIEATSGSILPAIHDELAPGKSAAPTVQTSSTMEPPEPKRGPFQSLWLLVGLFAVTVAVIAIIAAWAGLGGSSPTDQGLTPTPALVISVAEAETADVQGNATRAALLAANATVTASVASALQQETPISTAAVTTDPSTALPTSTYTPKPSTETPTLTFTPELPTTLPTSTYTPKPSTETPTLTSTRETPTAQPTSTFTPRPTTPAPTRVPVVETMVVVLQAPNDCEPGSGMVSFQWLLNTGVLSPNQAMELVFWKSDQDAMRDGFGLAEPVRDTAAAVTVNFPVLDDALAQLEPGEYRWGVLLVDVAPYRRVRMVSESRCFRYERAAGAPASAPTRAPW